MSDEIHDCNKFVATALDPQSSPAGGMIKVIVHMDSDKNVVSDTYGFKVVLSLRPLCRIRN